MLPGAHIHFIKFYLGEKWKLVFGKKNEQLYCLLIHDHQDSPLQSYASGLDQGN